MNQNNFDLVSELHKVCDAKVIAVGDDWQAIYAFSGSDVSLFLDFEIKLVQSETLPASNHEINQISIGGAIQPGQAQKFSNFWKAIIGVVIKNLGEEDSVYSLLYHIKLEFNKTDFMRYSGLDLTNIDDELIVYYILYKECYRIYEEELLPIKG